MVFIEEIFYKKIDKRVKNGERIWLPLDLVVMRDFGGPNAILEYKNYFGSTPVFDKSKVVITFDLYGPARDEKIASNQQICRKFAKEMGLRLFDVNEGIGQHVLFENDLVNPYDIIIGTDSHINLLGALNCFATGVGTTDIVAGMRYGKMWYRIPKTMKIEINGKLKEYVTPKDIILYILKNLHNDGAIGYAIEFTGEVIKNMDLAGKITIASMVTELSGEIGFFTDGNGDYDKEYKFDISDIEPQIACPHSPDNVKNVSEVVGTQIDQVFIGSCTNGRYEDLELAAKILKGNKVKSRLIIVPATKNVAKNAIENGLYDVFLSSGAVIVNPGCSLCTTGHPGILAFGEKMLSTSNRNFIGKLGKGSEVYLASPVIAAFTAIEGKISMPC